VRRDNIYRTVDRVPSRAAEPRTDEEDGGTDTNTPTYPVEDDESASGRKLA
jgi:hypothetical protein